MRLATVFTGGARVNTERGDMSFFLWDVYQLLIFNVKRPFSYDVGILNVKRSFSYFARPVRLSIFPTSY